MVYFNVFLEIEKLLDRIVLKEEFFYGVWLNEKFLKFIDIKEFNNLFLSESDEKIFFMDDFIFYNEVGNFFEIEMFFIDLNYECDKDML